MHFIRNKLKCRFCNSENLSLILDLGFCPLTDNFLSKSQLQEPEIYYPMEVYLCAECGLSQLGYVPPLEKIFHNDYAYEAGTTKTRRDHHFQMAESICNRFNLHNSLAVDIGSNVGILLEGFRAQNMKIIGVDASDNVAEIARKKDIETITGFFNPTIAKEILEKHGQASVITATNVFAHLNDFDSFIKGIDSLLTENGVFVFQVHYFLDLIEKLQYDMIFHEHILFESILPLRSLFDRLGFTLFDVERFEIDGGVIRCYVCRKDQYLISNNVEKLIKLEDEHGIHSKYTLFNFAKSVKQHREEMIKLLETIHQENKRIVAISMPAKGVALLNYCGIGKRLIEYATERSELKIGKFAPGSHIPIKSDDYLLTDKPDFALLLAWNFEKEIIANNQEFLNQGGKFIVPIPHPRVVSL